VRRRQLGVLLGCTFLLIVSPAAVVIAQGGQPGLTLSVDQVDPGGSLTVSGTGLGDLPQVFVSLVGPDEPVVLGLAETKGNGDFTITVTVPPDTPDGDYTISVTTAAGDDLSAPLQVGTVTDSQAATSDEGVSASDDSVVEPVEAPVPSDASADAAPLGSGVRALAFVVLVAGSFVVAAWGFGARWRE
jgi:hypothetical protein